MAFLPLQVGGVKVYAGFWKRAFAALIDMLVLLPVSFALFYAERSMATMTATAIVGSFLYATYSIVFNARFGATLGKMAAGIKITFPNGERIGLKQAMLRSSVDVLFACFYVAAQLGALANVDSAAYLSASWMERAELRVEHFPGWYSSFVVMGNIWVCSELVVLLFNARKRSLHDYLAGTVVIRRQFAL